MCKCTESKASEAFKNFVAMNNTLIIYAAKHPNPCPDMLREIRHNTESIIMMAGKVKCDGITVKTRVVTPDDVVKVFCDEKIVAEAIRRSTINPANHY